MSSNLQPQETPEYCTFRENYDKLYQTIQDPLTLATQLFAQGIITSAVKEDMNVLGRSRLEKNEKLLGAVATQIQNDASKFGVFLTTLNEDPPLQSLVKSMQSKFLICGSINASLSFQR